MRSTVFGTGDSTYTFKGLAPGQHELVAVIGYGDHSAMAGKRGYDVVDTPIMMRRGSRGFEVESPAN